MWFSKIYNLFASYVSNILFEIISWYIFFLLSKALAEVHQKHSDHYSHLIVKSNQLLWSKVMPRTLNHCKSTLKLFNMTKHYSFFDNYAKLFSTVDIFPFLLNNSKHKACRNLWSLPLNSAQISSYEHPICKFWPNFQMRIFIL